MRNSYFVQFFANIATAASLLFIPIIAGQFGLDLFQIGLVGAMYSIGAFISYYFFGRLSDNTGNRRGIIRIGMLVCAAVFPLQIFMFDFASMLAVRFAAGFALGIYTFPLVAAVAEFNHRKKMIASLAAAGSLGWFFGMLGAGIIADFNTIFILSGFMCLIGFFFALRLPKGKAIKLNVSLFPKKLIKRNAAVYATFFLRHLGGNTIWIILPLYMVSLGASLLWVGVLFAVNMLTQVIFSKLAGKLSDRISDVKIIRLGVLFSAIAFISYAFATNFLHLLPVQFLIGIAWAFIYTGSLMNLTAKNIEKASATALLGDTIRLAMIIGPFLGGTIAFLFNDFRATMYAAFFLGLAALAISREL